MTTKERTTQWGNAWVALAIAIALHVADEATTDFLPLYNSIVRSLRDDYPWVPLPTFSFSTWLGGLIGGVILLLGLSPLVYSGTRVFRPISYVLGVLMIFNASGHIGGSIYLGSLAPGAISSPVLLLAAVALVIAAARAGRATGSAD